MWMLVAFLCAGYVFVGIAVVGVAIWTGNWIYIIASVLMYITNLVLLEIAKRQEW